MGYYNNQLYQEYTPQVLRMGNLGQNYIPRSLRLRNTLKVVDKKSAPNFQARYTNRNKSGPKGIINMHINIRSLLNKVNEVKLIVKEHKPHIIGISESEIRNVDGNFCEEKLKIPGYNILFPNSWNKEGFARVVVYVKKTFECDQISDLQDDLIQSIWIRGGFKSGKKIYFCHGYREHASRLGAGISHQKQYLERFLSQGL